MKYTYFELKNVVIQGNEFPIFRLSCAILVFQFGSSTIESDDTWIKCHIAVNEYGAYLRAALFYIFALICSP